MTQLKTLKDIPHRNKGFMQSVDDIQTFKDNLKAEAIKKAKYFDNKMSEAGKGEIEEIWFIYYKGRFDEVMEANNLTEEDLKGGNLI